MEFLQIINQIVFSATFLRESWIKTKEYVDLKDDQCIILYLFFFLGGGGGARGIVYLLDTPPPFPIASKSGLRLHLFFKNMSAHFE